MLKNIKSILVDVDPERAEQPALDRARLLGARTKANIHLFVCDHVHAASSAMIFDQGHIEEAQDAYLNSVGEWLEAQAAQLRDDEGLDVSTKVARHSPRYEAILDYAEEIHADIIIRAAAERSKIKRMILGATDWELIRRVPQVLWLVKKNQFPDSGVRMLAAVDPTHRADEEAKLDVRILDTTKRFCDLFSGQMHVFHAYMLQALMPPLTTGPNFAPAAAEMPRVDPEMLEKLRESHRESVMKLIRNFGVSDENTHIVAGDTTTMIETVVEEQKIDAIVAGAVSRGWLERLVIGNTAEKFLDAVDCDCIVVKPPGFEADG